MNIVIPGQLGQHLASHFRQQGHHVIVLSRRAGPNTEIWDGKTLGDWARVIDDCDVVLNLAGRTVNCRYNGPNRVAIYFSRIDSTRVIGEAIARSATPPRLWLNASTATIYRHALDRAQDETTGEIWRGDEPGVPDKWHFSVDVARRWEAEVQRASTPNTRQVMLRMSMVMDPAPGGVFSVLRSLARLRLGGFQGDGRQMVSWIHIDDLCRALDLIIENHELSGPVNVCGPEPVSNREFMRELRGALGIRVGLPATAWMLELGAVAMRTETELLLKSRWVIPSRLQAAGFSFEHPQWALAARDLAQRMT